ncbi:MAG: hypothetical protein ACQESV_04345 [Thermodesulfobacteriota bacterium]
MHIVQSNIQFTAQREYTETYWRQESLQLQSSPANQGRAFSAKPASPAADRLNISPEARASHKAADAKGAPHGRSDLSPQLTALIEFIEQTTGKKVKLMDPQAFHGSAANAEPEANGPDDTSPTEASEPRTGLEYHLQEQYTEIERTSVQASGRLETADGKRIKFNMEVHMSRSFMRAFDLQLQAGQRIDPLVVNYQGLAGQVTQERFAFDLDVDGNKEEIAAPGPGSGFLAVDANNDGEINDGSELFGPQTGNGFDELAAHDEDDNGWIDAADPIFGELKIWSKTNDGEDQLVGLGKLGIGAIYLSGIESAFSIKGAANADLAQVKRTGMYIMENGYVGSMQEMDFIGEQTESES